MLDELVRATPRDHGAWYWLAVVHLRRGRADLALAAIAQALALDRRNPDYHNLQGVAFAECGEYEQAVQSIRKALKVRPILTDGYFNLGKVLRKQGKLNEAIDALGRARRLDARRADIAATLGRALIEAGRMREAHDEYSSLVRECPREAMAHSLLATTTVFIEGAAAAEAIYRRAVTLHPHVDELRWEFARFLLSGGRFEEGWRESLWRPTRANRQPPPRRADLEGKTLLFEQEQGIGDVLFFCRFVPALRQRGSRFVLRCEAKLKPLVSRFGVFDEVHSDPAAARATRADFVLPLDDAPAILASPAAVPSLRVMPRAPAAWKQRLAGFGPPPHIAVTWRAGTDNSSIPEFARAADFLYKEVEKVELARALKGAPGTLVAVQRQPKAGEIAALAAAAERPVHDLGALNDDLEEMSELLFAVDEYIGVSNTNMHLRAALGRTARVLIPFPPDWRWMREGDESPWFPGFGVYRRSATQDWTQAFERLHADLLEKWRG